MYALFILPPPPWPPMCVYGINCLLIAGKSIDDVLIPQDHCSGNTNSHCSTKGIIISLCTSMLRCYKCVIMFLWVDQPTEFSYGQILECICTYTSILFVHSVYMGLNFIVNRLSTKSTVQ